MRSYLLLLRNNPDFARLWLAQVVSLMGDWFNTIALMALVVAYSPESSGMAVSGLILARFVPPMLISPAAGVLIDRFDRRKLLIWCNLLRAFVQLGFLLATTGPEWLWLIYALSVAQFTLSAVFEPGVQAITPSLVQDDDLIPANTLNNVTWSAMLAVGAVIGGVFAAALGTNAALVFDALTFVVAGVLTRMIRMPVTASLDTVVHAAGVEKQKVTFLDGVRYLRAHPQTATTLLVKFGGSLANSDTFLAVFATRLFVVGDGGTLSLGILHSAFGIGAIAGPILLNRINNGEVRRMRWLILVGFVWIAMSWFVLSAADALLVVCIGFFIRAMGGSVNWTYSTVIIQKTTDNAFLGRVSSWDWALFYGAVVIGTLMNGTLIDRVGEDNIRIVTTLMGILSIVVLLLWFALAGVLERRRDRTVAPATGVTGD
ncbi:MAG: MFS transporter [Chloroflexi bacterium]|nr:MFS transporter [Chloroflexota bacterium]